MAPPKEGPPPHHKYGSVDTSEEPASQCSLLPTSRWNINPSFLTTAGGQRRPPQQKNEDNLRDPQEERHISPRLAVAIVCGLAFLAGSGVSWSQSSGGRSRAAAASSGLFEVSTRAGIPAAETRPGEASSDVAEYADVVALEFTALNFYHVRDGKPGQDYPWLKDIKLIEPHRDTTLAVVGAREGFDYRWEVRAGSSSSGPGELGGVQSTATGAVTIVVLTQLDENVVVLEEVDEDGKVTNRLEETVMVKYVRREIRTLTDDEREEVLDAVSECYNANSRCWVDTPRRELILEIVYQVRRWETAVYIEKMKNAPYHVSPYQVNFLLSFGYSPGIPLDAHLLSYSVCIAVLLYVVVQLLFLDLVRIYQVLVELNNRHGHRSCRTCRRVLLSFLFFFSFDLSTLFLFSLSIVSFRFSIS